MKFLGRKIGFKALKTRLNKLQAKEGVISLLSIGHDFFLVKFSNKNDMDFALIKGPWMIYDHYLTVRS